MKNKAVIRQRHTDDAINEITSFEKYITLCVVFNWAKVLDINQSSSCGKSINHYALEGYGDVDRALYIACGTKRPSMFTFTQRQPFHPGKTLR